MIKFYSEESVDFIMFDNIANQLLTMMGHGSGTEGSVSGEVLAAALDRLTSAVSREQDAAASDNSDEQGKADGWDESEEVTLSARAAPLIAMLRRASDADSYVMWRPE